MRWLLLKDLQILRRSPWLAAILVVYPVAIGLLIGFALSGDEGRPRVALLNQVPEREQVQLGGERSGLDRVAARDELCRRVECVEVESRREAEEMVADGEVLGALILPPDLLEKLESLTRLDPERPQVEVLVNEDDPVKAQLVDDRIQALVTEANLVISQRISAQASEYLDLVIEGGRLELPLVGEIEILGLRRAARILDGVAAELPPGSSARAALAEVVRFAEGSRENLDAALPLLGSLTAPITVEKVVLSGSTPELDTFAVAVALTVTLMFVTVLLVAGSLALEREENAFARIIRARVGHTGLLAEKLALGVCVSSLVAVAMLAAITALVAVDWGRAPAIVAAILAGSGAFAAFGAAIGAAARELRASALLAVIVSLPIAFLSLVPSGTVSAGAYDVIEVVRALFPFAPALDAAEAGLDPAGPALGVAVAHLAAIAIAYAGLARLALRRFAV